MQARKLTEAQSCKTKRQRQRKQQHKSKQTKGRGESCHTVVGHWQDGLEETQLFKHKCNLREAPRDKWGKFLQGKPSKSRWCRNLSDLQSPNQKANNKPQ